MNYQAIELAIYSLRSSIAPFPTIVNNVYCWGWESDLLYLSRNWHTTEYEIKISRSDYRADFKKDKHRKDISYLRCATLHGTDGPNYFNYVVPVGLLHGLEIPDYAGLIEVREQQHPYPAVAMVTKRAPRLHKSPLSERQRMSVILKGCNRYWQLKKHVTTKLSTPQKEASENERKEDV